MTVDYREIVADRPSGCGVCTVRSGGVCAAIPCDRPMDLATLKGSVRRVAAGCDLLRQGDIGHDIFTVLDGWLLLYGLLEDGRRQILGFALRGDVANIALSRHPSPFGIQALTPATVCTIRQERLMDLARQRPELALRMVSLIAREEMIAYEHLTSVGRRSARERVAHLLIEIYCRARLSFPVADAEALALPLTQTHIGDTLGLTAVHVNRTLRTLQADGVIAYAHGRLFIRDPDRLAATAGFDREVSLPWLQAPE